MDLFKFKFQSILLKQAIAAVLVMSFAGFAPQGSFAEDIKSVATVTVPTKKDEQAKIQESDKLAPDQANALNKIPGVQVSTEDLKQKSVKKGVDLNPVSWLFRPVIKLEQQSVLLEQQIMKLTGPIAALQPGMLGLGKRIDSVQAEISKVDQKLGGVQGQMSAIQSDISAMHEELSEIKKPVTDLKGPIMQLKAPILAIQEPITGVNKHLNSLDKELNDLKTLLSLVLTSIFAAAVLVAVGTPMAAILIWRNKAKLFPAPKPQDSREEASINAAGKVMNQQLRR